MTILEFMQANPLLTFGLAIVAMFTLAAVAEGLGPKGSQCRCLKDHEES